jgi:rod shape-determining protein MreD
LWTLSSTVPWQTSIVRAALLVAVAAVLEAALSPFLSVGFVAPRFAFLGIVVAVAGLREPQALLLGFFGGVLTDALSGGFFGIGAMSGIVAAVASLRLGPRGRKGGARQSLALATFATVAAYDVLGLLALGLVGSEGPPFGRYLLWGVLPDALLNGVLTFLVGGLLLRLVTVNREGNGWA